MQRLGHTRSSQKADHALLTPDTFVRTPLPGMKNATAIIHAAPAMGAAFTEYTAEFEPGGHLGPTEGQRFLYVLEGEIEVSAGRKKQRLSRDGYAYLPADGKHHVLAAARARAVVIEKPYLKLKGRAAPQALFGNERMVVGQPLMGDEALEVRTLLPDDFAFDFAVNTMIYQPGAALAMVEAHIMEHGLLMLEGGGIYRLGDSWYPVAAGDFIWMAPYCLQWFGALGKTPARYLIYKDWNRHPLAE
ncbi:MAG TPA: (S)-ureidoglycine aminohydrolase [Terriglobales bacterium]|nr:(S)-ureidoglycine aminohydrolase [Terriglobales bacterium]